MSQLTIITPNTGIQGSLHVIKGEGGGGMDHRRQGGGWKSQAVVVVVVVT